MKGVDIIGVGPDPSSAMQDGIRQIREVFGRCRVSAESVVSDFVLKRDVIRQQSRFSGSRLDRFYQGTFRRGNRYYAVFTFPADFLRSLNTRNRDELRARFFASFDEIQYSSVEADSFGENSGNSWRMVIPRCVRRFVDFFVWDIDGARGVEVVRVCR
jgi:hypothetical protein